MKDPEHHTTPRDRVTRYKLPWATGIRMIWWQKSDGSRRCNLKDHLDMTDLRKWDEIMKKKGPYKRNSRASRNMQQWGEWSTWRCDGVRLILRGCFRVSVETQKSSIGMDLHSWEEVWRVKCGDYKLPSEPDKCAGATQGTRAGTKPLYPTQAACSMPSGHGFSPDGHTTWGHLHEKHRGPSLPTTNTSILTRSPAHPILLRGFVVLS